MPTTNSEAISYPNTVKINIIDRKHPFWSLCAPAWEELPALVKGGVYVRALAGSLLSRREREPADVFASRQERITYQNIIGPIFGWYRSSLFADEPRIEWRAKSENGKTAPLAETKAQPYTEFLQDCDRTGKTLIDHEKDILDDAMAFGSAVVLVDNLPNEAGSKQEARQQGTDRPHLVRYCPTQLINWQEDKLGNMEWAVLKSRIRESSPITDAVEYDCWYVFDQTGYAEYRRKVGETKDDPTLQGIGPHALTEAGRCPVFRFVMPENLWLGNRVWLCIREHLNADNALSWSLHQANLALMVAKADGELNLTKSETSLIQLPANGDLFYLEPSGSTATVSLQRLESLREECYRQCYLQVQGRTADAVAGAQSGYSKQQDMAPALNILEELGSLIAKDIERKGFFVAMSRQEPDVIAAVTGFVFAEDDPKFTADSVDDARRAGVQSDTLYKVLGKRLALGLVDDEPQEVKETIAAEIDAAPTESEKAEEEKKAAAGGGFGGLTSGEV